VVLPILREIPQRRALPDPQPTCTVTSPRVPRVFLQALQTAGHGALALLAFLVCDSFSRRFPGFGDVQHDL
jgi:hypothetical protein